MLLNKIAILQRNLLSLVSNPFLAMPHLIIFTTMVPNIIHNSYYQKMNCYSRGKI